MIFFFFIFPSFFLFWWTIEQETATAYEKAVFETVSYFISPARDDDEAYELHLKVSYMYFDLSILLNCNLSSAVEFLKL